jgi:hypothetical protein
MTKEQKKAAIVVALREYQDNLGAVQESDIPGGFDQLVRNALVKTLGDKFERIFDQPGASPAFKAVASTSTVKPTKTAAKRPATKSGKKK